MQFPSATASCCLVPADQFPEEKRERYCRKAAKLVGATLAATKFARCPVVPVSARPGGQGRLPMERMQGRGLPMGVLFGMLVMLCTCQLLLCFQLLAC